MKRVVIAMTAVVITCGVSLGQDEPGPNFEHLKAYGPMIGTWRYEGPLLEDVPGMAEKGAEFVAQFSWRRILNRNAVEENWSGTLAGKEFSGKALIGWNAKEQRLVYGAMDSEGGMSLGTVVFDKQAKTSTLTSEGIDGDGEPVSFKAVVTKTGKDTLTWQALERTGGTVEGPSPVYTFKRVQRAMKSKKVKPDRVLQAVKAKK
jgi:hypothetical protein